MYGLWIAILSYRQSPLQVKQVVFKGAEIPNSAIISELSSVFMLYIFVVLRKKIHKTNIFMAPWQVKCIVTQQKINF